MNAEERVIIQTESQIRKTLNFWGWLCTVLLVLLIITFAFCVQQNQVIDSLKGMNTQLKLQNKVCSETVKDLNGTFKKTMHSLYPRTKVWKAPE